MPKYEPIRVSTLRGDQPIPFNAYVRVAGKYILFCREGDSFEDFRLERLKEKKLQRMWIDPNDASAYNSYLTKNVRAAYEKAENKPIEVRTQIIQGILQAATEDLIEDPSDESKYKVLIGSLKDFHDFIFKEKAALLALLRIKNTDHNIAHHGVNVCTISIGLAQTIGLHETNPMQMIPFSVGCLIHDIEHHFSNVNIQVPPIELKGQEKAIYHSHSIDGAQRLLEHHFYDPLVLDIVKHHEEKIDGSGICSLREKNMSPFVKIAIAANAFDHYLKYREISIKESLKDMLIDKMGICPLDVMKALQDMLKSRGFV